MVDEDGLVVDVCWFAFAPLVTLCEPLPIFTPGLTSAPMFALELLTSTFASTPTFGLTFSVLELELDGLVLDDELEGLVLDDELELGLVFEDELLPALMSVELDDELGLDALPEPFTPRLEELEELEGVERPRLMLRSVELEELPGVEALPFRLMPVELEERPGAEPLPFRLMSVELDELPGVEALPLRLMSVERDDPPGVATPFNVVEDELDPGTTAMPGTSVVVVLLDCARGTLGMHPAGVVFAASVHFGSCAPLVTLVMVSARAAPKAANSEAARRLILKVFLFIALPPFWTRSRWGTGVVAGLRSMVHAGPWQVVHGPGGMVQGDHFVGERLQMQCSTSDIGG